jgi:hypothetical protein
MVCGEVGHLHNGVQCLYVACLHWAIQLGELGRMGQELLSYACMRELSVRGYCCGMLSVCNVLDAVKLGSV